jgi:F-type H+-transporting ATPase subunit c
MVQVAKIIGTGLARTVIGAKVGIGIVLGALILCVFRNPSLRGQLFSYAILGFAFSEATGLFAIMMAFWLLISCYKYNIKYITFFDILKFLFCISLLLLVKLPLNEFLYCNINYGFLAFIIALLMGKILSDCVNHLFNSILNNKENFSLLFIPLSIYLESSLQQVFILSYASVISTMPSLSRPLTARAEIHRRFLQNRFNQVVGKQKAAIILEPISSALDRDRTDRKHGSLHDCFQEYLAETKKEFLILANELTTVTNLIANRGSIPSLMSTTDYL